MALILFDARGKFGATVLTAPPPFTPVQAASLGWIEFFSHEKQ